MGELLGGESRIDAVIGPGCSSVCEVTSYLSAGQGIPQLSFSCTSPTLSAKKEFELVDGMLALLNPFQSTVGALAKTRCFGLLNICLGL